MLSQNHYTTRIIPKFSYALKFIDPLKIFDLQITSLKYNLICTAKSSNSAIKFLQLALVLWWHCPCYADIILLCLPRAFSQTWVPYLHTLNILLLGNYNSVVQVRSSSLRNDHLRSQDMKEDFCMDPHYLHCTSFYCNNNMFFTFSYLYSYFLVNICGINSWNNLWDHLYIDRWKQYWEVIRTKLLGKGHLTKLCH